MKDIRIRKAENSDLEQLIDLCKQHAEYEKAEYSLANKGSLLSQHLFKTEPSLNCLVAEDSGILVGYATFMKQFSTLNASFYLYLDCLFLQRRYRGLGLGRQLMEKVKEYALGENCIEIQWQTPIFNKNAIDFYKRLGAVSKSKERFFLDLSNPTTSGSSREVMRLPEI